MLLSTLVQALVTLLADLSGQPDSGSDSRQITNFITLLSGEECTRVSRSAIEKEYGVRFGKDDRDIDIREVIVSEAVMKCLEFGHENRRRWILHNLLEVSSL